MSIRMIACCTDFSKNAEAAFLTALELAEKYGAKLSIIHVLPPVINPMMTEAEWIVSEEPKKSLMLKVEERMRKEYGARIEDAVEFDLVVLDGHVSSEILRYLKQNKIDLVIMGSYGLSGMGLVVFGSVAKRVTHKAQCSVLIVRPKGAEI